MKGVFSTVHAAEDRHPNYILYVKSKRSAFCDSSLNSSYLMYMVKTVKQTLVSTTAEITTLKNAKSDRGMSSVLRFIIASLSSVLSDTIPPMNIRKLFA